MKRVLLAITLVGVLSGTALAGEMPGVNTGTATSDVPTVSSTPPPPPPPGEMPGVNPKSTTTPDTSVLTAVLLTFITLLGS